MQSQLGGSRTVSRGIVASVDVTLVPGLADGMCHRPGRMRIGQAAQASVDKWDTTIKAGRQDFAKGSTMHQFPGEEDRSAGVQRSLADLFNLAESLFNYWLDQDKNSWRADVPMESANLALILDVQALRLFRSIVEDCK